MVEQVVTSSFKLGIIAGGQLGKMLALAAGNWDVRTHVMDSSLDCPCASVCTKLVQGTYSNFDDVYNFGQTVDIITYELEAINIEALQKLKSEGKRIYPDPDALTIIQDKGLQKQFYVDHGIPSSSFQLMSGKNELVAAIESGQVHYPFVQKARTGGYDGRGVAVINSPNDLEKLMDTPSVIEQKVPIDKELAVIANRNPAGEIVCFPSVEMEFNPESNLVEQLVCPASIEPNLEHEAVRLAHDVIEKFDLVGTLAIEFFLDDTGKLMVNEVAPRPHNSGHHTIESVITSQFEQHLRSVLGFPLGSTKLKMPAVMVNLVGQPGHNGPVKYDGLHQVMALEGVKVHIYGKSETRPHRKMGHVTIIAPTLDEARRKAKDVRNTLFVKAWETQSSAL